MLLPDATGHCPFHDREAHRCRVHSEHGETMLPSSCFHFPRRALVDDRGVFVNLSHFCPTAATLLLRSPDRLAVVESPAAFPGAREYDGLDGREAWPPLVRADLLFDLPAYTRWEGFLLSALDQPAAGDASVWDQLRLVAAAAEHLRAWTPEDGPLHARVGALERRTPSDDECDRAWGRYAPLADIEAYERVRRCVPDGLRPPAVSADVRRRWRALGGQLPMRVARRYVAAKAFAAWAAYDAFGVRTMVAELAVAALVLHVEAARRLADASTAAGSAAGRALDDAACIEVVRAADWLLMHLVDRSALLEWLGQVEQRPIDMPAPGA